MKDLLLTIGDQICLMNVCFCKEKLCFFHFSLYFTDFSLFIISFHKRSKLLTRKTENLNNNLSLKRKYGSWEKIQICLKKKFNLCKIFPKKFTFATVFFFLTKNGQIHESIFSAMLSYFFFRTFDVFHMSLTNFTRIKRLGYVFFFMHKNTSIDCEMWW